MIKNLEDIFNEFHSNWKYFYLINKEFDDKVEIVEFNTTECIKNSDYLLEFVNKNMGITEPDYELIKDFYSN
jgi:hypothetical protein